AAGAHRRRERRAARRVDRHLGARARLAPGEGRRDGSRGGSRRRGQPVVHAARRFGPRASDRRAHRLRAERRLARRLPERHGGRRGAAAKLELEIREIARRTGGGAVCTMGGVVTKPGIVTSVVETAECLLDQRHLDAATLASMLDEAKRASERFAREESIDVEWERIWSSEPILFDETLIALADEAIREVAGQSHRLPSGPLHDASETARAGIPTVMI